MVASSQGQRRINNDAAIPVLDLGAYLSGVPGALGSTAVALREALEDIGFFLIVNHGVPQELIDPAQDGATGLQPLACIVADDAAPAHTPCLSVSRVSAAADRGRGKGTGRDL